MKTNLENYEERFVDYMEGQLNAEEMREVEAFVAQHPELEKDFKLFCSTKLEPDTSLTYAKKESLMKPTTAIKPLYVRIIAAAACAALLIGLGIRFLQPHEVLPQQPLMAELAPIEAQPINTSQEVQELRKSNMKVIPVAKPTHQTEEPVAIASIVPITEMPLIGPKPLQFGTIAYGDPESRMFAELGERLVTLEPFDDIISSSEDLLNDPQGQALASIQGSFFSNVRQTTKDLYKQTAKTVMDVYYTADYCINEAKSSIDVRRELVNPQ